MQRRNERKMDGRMCSPAISPTARRRGLTVQLLGVAVVLIMLAGCSDLKGFGVSSWPLYRQLAPAPELTGDEKKALVKVLSAKQVARLKTLASSEAYYRAVVETHNKHALAQREKVQRAIGDDADLDALKKVWAARIAPLEQQP